jgi:hypothetical protein
MGLLGLAFVPVLDHADQRRMDASSIDPETHQVDSSPEHSSFPVWFLSDA